MDFSIYIDSIIEKLRTANYYSEIEESDLRWQMEEYLRKEYNKRVEIAAFKYDMAQANKDPQTMDEVKLTLAGIKSEIISLVRELSKSKL